MGVNTLSKQTQFHLKDPTSQEIEAVTAALRDGWLAPGPRYWAQPTDLF